MITDIAADATPFDGILRTDERRPTHPGFSASWGLAWRAIKNSSNPSKKSCNLSFKG
jgi:hypothetical protein